MRISRHLPATDFAPARKPIPNSTANAFPLRVTATIRVSTTANLWFPLFLEPYKGDYADFIGMEWLSATQLNCRSRLAGVDQSVTYTTTEDTNDHVYELRYLTTSVKCLIDGFVFATLTTNLYQYGYNISGRANGPEVECCEPNSAAMSTYLKMPGILNTSLP